MRSHHPACRSLLAILIVAGICVPATDAAAADAVAAPSVLQFLQPDNLDHIRNSEILGIPISNCAHVIDLLTVNRIRRQTGITGTQEYILPHLTAGLRPGDLQLVSVALVCDGTLQKGPIYQITMKNCSTVPIGRFHVSIVGVLGLIDVYSPSATGCVPRMEPGEVTVVQIQLPVTCMTMGPVTSPTPFDTVVVAVDSFDTLVECDELNNVLILKRSEIPLLAEETPATPDVVESVPAAPQEAAPATPPDSNGTSPGQDTPSPLDSLDLDELDLEESQSLRLRHS